LLDLILICLFFAIPYYYVILCKLYSLSLKHKDTIIRDVEGLKMIKLICETFKSAAMPIVHYVDSVSGIEEDHVAIGKDKYIIKFCFGVSPIHESLIKAYQAEGEKRKTPILILSKQELTEGAAKIAADSAGMILIIVLEKEVDFKGKLWERVREARKFRASASVPLL
jgi:hypothetical protein